MTEFVHFNLPAYNTNQNVITLVSPRSVCVCCLAQDGTMVNLVNCKHKRFLQDYFLMDYSMDLVCNNCHNMLKKIQTFKNQVEECCMILKQQGLKKFRNKFNLLQSNTTVISNVTNDVKSIDSEEKEKPEFSPNDELRNNTQTELTTDVKLEAERDSDFENDLPLTKIKKRKKKQKGVKLLEEVISLEEKYNGKIQLIILSKEALMEERERESKREEYIKLPFKCEKCIKGFDHEVTLKMHIEKQHKKEGVYRCEVCESVLGSEYSFKEHLRRHVKRFECMACWKRTSDVYTVTQHFNQHHADLGIIDQEFKCTNCEFTTDSHRIYRYHRQKHTQRKRCLKCDKTFATTSGLRTHMNTVHSDVHPKTRLKYQCSACDKIYRCKSALMNHTASAHGNAPGAYCGKCGKHYASLFILQQHLKTNSAHITEDNKKFVCHDCGAKFLTKPLLRAHIEWEHLKRLEHQCKICSKVLKTAVTLKKHHRYVHEKKKLPRNKICDHCGRAFTSTNILLTHIRTHTGERPLACVHCSATFAHAAALYTHKKLKHKSLKSIQNN